MSLINLVLVGVASYLTSVTAACQSQLDAVPSRTESNWAKLGTIMFHNDGDDDYHEHMAFHERPRGLIDSLYAATGTVVRRAKQEWKQLWTKMFNSRAADQGWLISPYRTSEYVASSGGLFASLGRKSNNSRGYIELDSSSKLEEQDKLEEEAAAELASKAQSGRPEEHSITNWIIKLANYMGTGIHMSHSIMHYPRVSLYDGSVLNGTNFKQTNQFNLAQARMI